MEQITVSLAPIDGLIAADAANTDDETGTVGSGGVEQGV